MCCRVWFQSQALPLYLTGNRTVLSPATVSTWEVLYGSQCGLACCESCRYQVGFQTARLFCCEDLLAGALQMLDCPSQLCSPVSKMNYGVISIANFVYSLFYIYALLFMSRRSCCYQENCQQLLHIDPLCLYQLIHHMPENTHTHLQDHQTWTSTF